MLSASHVAAWAELAAAGLHAHRDEINQLNVFPIPDSDTGTNMTSTMESAVERMHRDHGPVAEGGGSVADVAASLAAGAVVGARGNSGLVLSQLLRALADAASNSGSDELPVAEVPRMLHRAEKLVRRAVSDPVEGTIISVLHAAAERADEILGTDDDPDMTAVIAAARDAAEKALYETPSQLDVLAEAGVVDAGGRGLVVILDALVDALNGAESEAAESAEAAQTVSVQTAQSAQTDAGSEDQACSGETAADAEIEVMFSYRGDIDVLRGDLERMGNSVVTVPIGTDGTESADSAESTYGEWRVHVHTREGGPLIENAYSSGEVSDLRLEALPLNTQGADEKIQLSRHPVLALVPEGGLREVFAGAGATVGDVATIIEALGAYSGEECIVLTNGQDTAELFDVLSSISTEATVIDTECFVGGLAALAVYSPDAGTEDNAEEMADAVSSQRWATIRGGAGDIYDGVVELLEDGGELVTILYGDDGDDTDEGEGEHAWDSAAVEQLEQSLTDYCDERNMPIDIHGFRVPELGAAAQVGVE